MDLTNLIARENNLKVDKNEFDKYLEEQRERSRNSSTTSSEEWTVITDNKESNFVGYSKGFENIKNIVNYSIKSKIFLK